MTRIGDIASIAARPRPCNRSTTTPCSAWSTSPPTSTAAISAAWRPRSRRSIAEEQKDLPSTAKIFLRGQNEVMETSFRNLGLGLMLAIILVYAVLVVLFQSWVDPFIIMMAVPGALIGILWMLAITGTTINVASLMGAIMSVGIAVSNSILVVSFANDLRAGNESLTPFAAVIEAGKTRLRPVLMTALAMIIGMVPMALGLGEAGEQNAPLGRAVIGGLARRDDRHAVRGADLLHAAAAQAADPAQPRRSFRSRGSRLARVGEC